MKTITLYRVMKAYNEKKDVLRREGYYSPEYGLFKKKYAWAIPTEECLDLCVKLSPIVEMGAGRGLWARLISDAGGTVKAFDAAPPDQEWNSYTETESDTLPEPSSDDVYFPVEKAGPRVLAVYSDRALLLVWPPPKGDMAEQCLKFWKGDILIYVGEGRYGCTGTHAFFDLLDEQFVEVQTRPVVYFGHCGDNLHVYLRKDSAALYEYENRDAMQKAGRTHLWGA